MTTDESTGLILKPVALKQVTAPGPDRLRCRALARSLVSGPLNKPFAPGGRADLGSWSREATCRWHLRRFTCCPSLSCAF